MRRFRDIVRAACDNPAGGRAEFAALSRACGAMALLDLSANVFGALWWCHRAAMAPAHRAGLPGIASMKEACDQAKWLLRPVNRAILRRLEQDPRLHQRAIP